MLMKKTLLLSALLFSAAAANAADVTATYQASAWLKSANMCNFDAVAPANATDFYVGGTFDNGTATKTAEALYWSDTEIVAKDSYTGSIVKNVLLARADAQCAPVWTIAPDFAQCENNSVFLTRLQSGSAVYAFNLRASNAASGKAFSFTDKAGKKVEISVAPQATATNTNCGLILCLSPNGVYQWHVVIEADNFTAEDTSVAAPVTFTATSIVADSHDNVFLAGNYGGGYLDFGNGVKAPAAANTTITNGKAAGATSFVVKINHEGKATSVLTALAGAGAGAKETQQVLATDGSQLALAEYADAAAGKSIRYFRLDGTLDLVADPTEYSIATTGTVQLSSAAFHSSELLINGNSNQALTQDDEKIFTPAAAAKLEGLTIRASFTPGAPSTCYATGVNIGQTNYSWVNDGKLLTYGYCMTGSKVNLNVFDYATAERLQTIDLAVAGTTKSAFFNENNNTLYGTSYARSASFPGTDVKYTATAFNGILGAWNVAGLSGAINSVADDTVDADAPVEYFNLQGMRVVNPSKGSLVIRRQGTKVAKVIF